MCRCRQRKCDCERWERIYREKFEDPTYYLPRTATLQSSLGGMTPLDLKDAVVRNGEGGADRDRWRVEMEAQAKAARELREMNSDAA